MHLNLIKKTTHNVLNYSFSHRQTWLKPVTRPFSGRGNKNSKLCRGHGFQLPRCTYKLHKQLFLVNFTVQIFMKLKLELKNYPIPIPQIRPS